MRKILLRSIVLLMSLLSFSSSYSQESYVLKFPLYRSSDGKQTSYGTLSVDIGKKIWNVSLDNKWKPYYVQTINEFGDWTLSLEYGVNPPGPKELLDNLENGSKISDFIGVSKSVEGYLITLCLSNKQHVFTSPASSKQGI